MAFFRGFNRFGRELRAGRDIRYQCSNGIFRKGIQHDSRFRTQCQLPRGVRWQEDVHIDVAEIRQRQHLAAGRENFTGFGHTRLNPPPDGTSQRIVFYLRLEPFGLRLRGINRGLRLPDFRLRTHQSRPSRVGTGQIDVPLLLAHGTTDDEVFRALVLLVGISELGLLHRHVGERGIAIVLGLANLGLGRTQLRLEILSVHRRNHLTRIDGVPLVGEDCL